MHHQLALQVIEKNRPVWQEKMVDKDVSKTRVDNDSRPGYEASIL